MVVPGAKMGKPSLQKERKVIIEGLHVLRYMVEALPLLACLIRIQRDRHVTNVAHKIDSLAVTAAIALMRINQPRAAVQQACCASLAADKHAFHTVEIDWLARKNFG